MKSLFLSLAILLMSCDLGSDLNKTVDKDVLKKYAVDLKGKVLDKDSKPIKDAIIHVKKINKKDTTDENGDYQILADSIPSEGKDTLVILKESQILDIQEITVFVDSLPPLYIVQRDVYGSLDMIDSSQIGHIEAILTGDNIPGEKKIPLAWNKAANSFTTFFYMKNVLGTQYKIYVSVFDDKNRLIARSPDVEFTDLFGDIQVPVFACNNAKPIAIAKTNKDTVSIGDSILINADSSYDPFNGEITKYEWNVNGKGYNEGNADTGISVPTSLPLLKVSAGMANENGELNVVLKVLDNDQNEGLDTVKVNVVQDVPTITLKDTTVFYDSLVTIKANANDQFGSIVKYEWDIGNGFVEGTNTISILAKYDSLIIVHIIDDDGNSAIDSMKMSIDLHKIQRFIQIKNLDGSNLDSIASGTIQTIIIEYQNWINKFVNENDEPILDPRLSFSALAQNNSGSASLIYLNIAQNYPYTTAIDTIEIGTIVTDTIKIGTNDLIYPADYTFNNKKMIIIKDRIWSWEKEEDILSDTIFVK